MTGIAKVVETQQNGSLLGATIDLYGNQKYALKIDASQLSPAQDDDKNQHIRSMLLENYRKSIQADPETFLAIAKQFPNGIQWVNSPAENITPSQGVLVMDRPDFLFASRGNAEAFTSLHLVTAERQLAPHQQVATPVNPTITENNHTEPARNYPWPQWDNSLGEPPKIHFGVQPPQGYRQALDEKLGQIALAAKLGNPSSAGLRQQLAGLSGMEIDIRASSAGNEVEPATHLSHGVLTTIVDPFIRYNPNRSQRYVVEGSADKESYLGISFGAFDERHSKTAVASPEQLLLEKLASYEKFYQAHQLKQLATTKSDVEKQEIMSKAAEQEQQGKDVGYIADTVNRSMPALDSKFQPMGAKESQFEDREDVSLKTPLTPEQQLLAVATQLSAYKGAQFEQLSDAVLAHAKTSGYQAQQIVPHHLQAELV